MKKVILALFALILSNPVAADDEQALKEQSRRLVETYAENLKAELQAGMQSGGPLTAIEKCRVKAPEIARQLNTKDWRIGRTSLRARNPLNRPDKWEKGVLQRFERRQKDGEKIEELEYSETVQRGDSSYFRYMKAIPTQPLCLTCHGEKLDESLAGKLRRLYPEDQATGFAVGDIRGAFSVSRKLD